MGGTMRLGAYDCDVREGSKTFEAYGQKQISERHRHRYEFNNQYIKEYEKAGMQCVGTNPDSNLVEIVEIPTLNGTSVHNSIRNTAVRYSNRIHCSFHS